MTQPLMEMITHPQIVGYICHLPIYVVTQHTLLYIGDFTLHKSDVIDDDHVLYCIECCTPPGYYLQWNADPKMLSVDFYKVS